MRKTFKYRIYPTKAQKAKLLGILEECRWIYNKTLELRKNTWENEHKTLTLYDTNKFLVQWKMERKSLKGVFSQVLQNAQARVDKAFKGFFSRVKKGATPGYPRFRTTDRYDSFTFPQFGFSIEDDSKIKIAGVGHIKSRIHRPPLGKIKTCTIRKTATGKWYATFSVEIPIFEKGKTRSKKAIGIDVGLVSFATLSDGSKIENPRFFKQSEKRLAKAQRKLAKQAKGSPERKKVKLHAARMYEKMANSRCDFAHQESRKLVDKFDIICLEDLQVSKMLQDGFTGLHRSISDAAWSQFISFISYKAEEAGKRCVKVCPAYTSQTCSRCGTRAKKSLSERVHKCGFCGLVMDRDHNASLNILRLGMQSLANA